MSVSILTALVVDLCISAAGAGTVRLDLHFSDGSHEKTLLPSETTWLELSFEVTDGALYAANIPWDITETHSDSFSVLEKQLPEGWYDMLSDNGEPTVFPALSSGFHGFYTAEGSVIETGLVSGVLERYLIRSAYGGTGRDVISVVDVNPMNAWQLIVLADEFEDLTISPDSVRAIVLNTLPEPAALVLLALGGLMTVRRR